MVPNDDRLYRDLVIIFLKPQKKNNKNAYSRPNQNTICCIRKETTRKQIAYIDELRNQTMIFSITFIKSSDTYF